MYLSRCDLFRAYFNCVCVKQSSQKSQNSQWVDLIVMIFGWWLPLYLNSLTKTNISPIWQSDWWKHEADHTQILCMAGTWCLRRPSSFYWLQKWLRVNPEGSRVFTDTLWNDVWWYRVLITRNHILTGELANNAASCYPKGTWDVMRNSLCMCVLKEASHLCWICYNFEPAGWWTCRQSPTKVVREIGRGNTID
jgi:hypothetical protein